MNVVLIERGSPDTLLSGARYDKSLWGEHSININDPPLFDYRRKPHQNSNPAWLLFAETKASCACGTQTTKVVCITNVKDR